MLYTRRGDDGTSGLLCGRERFSKCDAVYEALGTLDELNSLLGVCRALAPRKKKDICIAREIRAVQECLFIIQAELAGALKSLLPVQVKRLERVIGRIEASIHVPHAFVVPGTTKMSALLDYARAISRKAERSVLLASKTQSVSENTRAYLNRLSSLLYALARYAAETEGKKEPSPSY